MPCITLNSPLVVSLDIVNATKVVTFNVAAELNLGQATLLVASSNSELAPVETKFDAGTQRATLVFTEDLPAGSKATLRVGFESALIDSMSGYYKSTWEKGTYALTQFEVRVKPVRMYAVYWIRHRSEHRSGGVRDSKRLDVYWGPWGAKANDLRMMVQLFSSHVFWTCIHYLTGLYPTGLDNYPDHMVLP